ncbi:hypothetical protein I4U23_010813 [Adineta vaga]|nr:hypothetical protein I4U23_010813 [Adineta vaga]
MVAVSNRSLLCEAFDGFSESSKTTGMYEFSIENARLSLLGACTGGSFHLLLARYSLHKISDGCDNRFLYHFVENNLISYDSIKKSDQLLPSIQQIFVVIHFIGKIVYSFVDPLGNDEPQRFYATKGKHYIAEGQRLCRDRQQSHLQSFYSKSAEIFPRLCVNMQRLLDAMLILYEMKKNGELQFAQVVDQTFATRAKLYIDKHLVFNKSGNGEIVSYVSLETCHITANLFDNYLFKNTLNLFNLEHSVNQPSVPSTQFRTLIAEKPSLEKRILQLPYQFFLRSDLKQPITNENGKRTNAPFHHVDNNLLNNILNKLVDQKILSTGYFISRLRAQQTHSFFKNPIPNKSSEKNQFLQHLEEYKISAEEYQNLLTRSNLPNNCKLLPEAKQLLTTRVEHRDDCTKYDLVSIVNLNNEEASNGTIDFNPGVIANTTDQNIFVQMPVAVTINTETTPSNVHPPDVKACVRAILQYPSIILSSSDIALATRHYSAVARQRSIQLMINKKLLLEDDYFVRKLSKSVKATKGFAKNVPRINDEQSRFEFIAALNEFGITWILFKSFFDLTKDGPLYFTGIEPFENVAKENGKRKTSQAASQSKRKKN